MGAIGAIPQIKASPPPPTDERGRRFGSLDFSRDGVALLSVADCDNDGTRDVLVGMPFTTIDGESHRGCVVLLSGASGAELRRWRGQESGDTFGFALSRMGADLSDVDANILVGAPGLDPQYPKAGYVALLTLRSGEHYRVIQGPRDVRLFGYAVCGCPDQDKDGKWDIAVSGPRWAFDAGGKDGTVALYSSETLEFLRSVELRPSRSGRDIVITGLNVVEDQNGDSVPEVVALEPTNNRIIVCSGDNMLEIMDVRGPGFSRFGAECTTVWFSDGRADIFVTAPVLESGEIVRLEEGKAYRTPVISGANGTQWGESISSVRDVEGGGTIVLVGAPGTSSRGSFFGMVGPRPNIDEAGGAACGRVFAVSAENWAIVHEFSARSECQGFGKAVVGVADSDGDGVPEAIIAFGGSKLPGIGLMLSKTNSFAWVTHF